MTTRGDTSYDVIVIGGGHNGLVCAATLAKSGRSVVVLEQRERAGGLAIGDPLGDFDNSVGMWHSSSTLRPDVIKKLELERHGLSLAAPSPVLVPQRQGSGILLHHDPDQAVDEIAAVSEKDAESYRRYRGFIGRVKPVMQRVLDKAPPDVTSSQVQDFWGLAADGWALRRLGREAMFDLLRIPPMCVADWLGERFETEALRCGMAMPAIYGSFAGPWSPGTAGALLRHEALSEPLCAGDPRALIDALVSASMSVGVEIRTETQIDAICVEDGRACGVKTTDGQRIDAKIVAASCDPKTTLLKLIGGPSLSTKLDQQISAYRSGGTCVKVDLLLSSPLRFASRPDDAFEHIRIADSIDDMERAFDAIKYNQMSDKPILEIYAPQPNAGDSNQNRDPERDQCGSVKRAAANEISGSDSATHTGNQHYVSIVAHFAPYDLEGGWTESARETFGDRVVAVLEEHAPGAASSVQKRRVLAPPDIERTFGAWGGHIHHGEPGLDQLVVRPTLSCARYRTPIDGLYLCGSGSHPGGGLTGAPGMLAAEAIQHDGVTRKRR